MRGRTFERRGRRAGIHRLQGKLRAFLARCQARDPSLGCPIIEELTRLASAVSPKTWLPKEYVT